MRTSHCPAAVAAALAIQASATMAQPEIEVFTLSTLPVLNAHGAAVYYVDALALLEQHLSADLPADPTRAQEIAAQRMAAFGPQLETRVRAAAIGLSRAAQLGIQRAPAIVFDGRWAVYGMTDVDAARQIFASRAARERRFP